MMSQRTDVHGPGRAADRAGGCVSVRPLGGALPGRNSTEKADGWSGLRQTDGGSCLLALPPNSQLPRCTPSPSRSRSLARL